MKVKKAVSGGGPVTRATLRNKLTAAWLIVCELRNLDAGSEQIPRKCHGIGTTKMSLPQNRRTGNG